LQDLIGEAPTLQANGVERARANPGQVFRARRRLLKHLIGTRLQQGKRPLLLAHDCLYLGGTGASPEGASEEKQAASASPWDAGCLGVLSTATDQAASRRSRSAAAAAAEKA